MNTSRDERSRALRARVFNFLPGSDFDDALQQAVEYHRSHPIEEDGQKADPEEHRESTMMPFLRKDVPYSLAKEIVEHMVLSEDKTPA